jgi:hypothetical protein
VWKAAIQVSSNAMTGSPARTVCPTWSNAAQDFAPYPMPNIARNGVGKAEAGSIARAPAPEIETLLCEGSAGTLQQWVTGSPRRLTATSSSAMSRAESSNLSVCSETS